MRIVLAGGAGDVGQHVGSYLCRQGHQLTILDKKEATFAWAASNNVTVYKGDLTDLHLLKDIVAGSDLVVNLAWSFSDNPHILFESDVSGHINLLEAAAAAQVKRVVYTSTAGVYGVPPSHIVEEDYTCRPDRARKPLYAVAKHCAEQLSLVLEKKYKLPTTILRFWWAFGDSIGGRHLQELIRLALANQPIQMAANAGGTFVRMDDLGYAIELAAADQQLIGKVYNIGSLFLPWPAIGQSIIDLTNSTSPLQLIASKDWVGPAFLNETWQLSWAKATREIGYQPQLSVDNALAAFRKALISCIDSVKNQPPKAR
ncbi:MAG TPA: NAD(P)-dependent oxidoreductase [Negativicutes bacterium]